MFSIKRKNEKNKAGKVFNKTASFWNMKLVRGALKYQEVSRKEDRALNVKPGKKKPLAYLMERKNREKR